MPRPTRDAGAAALGGVRSTEALHRTTLRLRDVVILVLAAGSLLLAADGRQHAVVAVLLLLVVLPYNRLLRYRLDRTGRVPGALAWGDQAIAAGFALVWPHLVAPALVAGLLDIAVAAVMVDRRSALRGAVAGGTLFTVAAVLAAAAGSDLPAGHLLALPAYAVSALVVAYAVGSVAGFERTGQQHLSSLLDSLEVVVYEMDAETLEVRYVSPYLSVVSGRPADEFLGDPSAFLSLIHRSDAAALLSVFAADPEQRRSYDLEYRIFDVDGRQRWVRNLASIEAGDDGRPLLRGSIADITAQKVAEEALAEQARTDALTGLVNRGELLELLADGGPEQRLLVFLDLDSFKRINDSLGHSAGDALLVQVAGRLRHAVRSGDVVARLGGDEFVVLLALGSGDDAHAVVRRVQGAFADPFALGGRSVVVTTSAGAVVVEPYGVELPEALLERADAAMYSAKRSGPGRSAFFTTTMREAALQRLDLESDVRGALERGQLHLVYQPIVRATDHVVVGHEALLRWEHPVRGAVPPDVFIPVAEASGLIVEIGRWVLQEACTQARRWREEHGGGRTMSVNLSALQLSDPGLVADVVRALADAGLPPTALCLEITETALIAHPEQALMALHALRATGVTIALDDFGTGFSSLSHLHRYPVDTVKVDRSFVARLGDGTGKDGLVTAILHLAAHMDLTVVAEGVETREQARRLAELGCDLLQGYALGRPDRAHGPAVAPLPRTACLDVHAVAD